jgi:hypothetical protein
VRIGTVSPYADLDLSSEGRKCGQGLGERGCGIYHQWQNEFLKREGMLSVIDGNDYLASSDGNRHLRWSNNYRNDRMGRRVYGTTSNARDDSLVS